VDPVFKTLPQSSPIASKKKHLYSLALAYKIDLYHLPIISFFFYRFCCNYKKLAQSNSRSSDYAMIRVIHELQYELQLVTEIFPFKYGIATKVFTACIDCL
jgi:hypothetical protein